jgi:hypothetical protein
MKCRVHRMTILVVDHERMREKDMAQVVENCRYADPSVLTHESRDVEWSDDHPLNRRDTQAQAVRDLFGSTPSESSAPDA